MNKRLKYILLPLSISLALGSCTDDLEQVPTSKITVSSFWQTSDDAKAAVIGAHKRLQNLMDKEYFLIADLRGEYYTGGAENDGSGYDYYYENDLSQQKPGVQWKGFYSVINDANSIIKYIDNVTNFTNEDQKSHLLAQAYAIRAYTYSLLVRTYGDVPLILEIPKDYMSPEIQAPRTPMANIYNQIEEDLNQAITLFGESNTIDDKYLISKSAAYALQAEIALTKASLLDSDKQQCATTALEAISNCLNSGSVSMAAHYSEIFDIDNERNSEIIWAIPFLKDETPSQPFPSRLYPTPSGIESKEGAEDLHSGANNTSYQFVSYKREVCELFDPADERAAETFALLYDDGNYYTSVSLKYDGSYNSATDERYYESDVVIFRWGEVKLMEAEAFLLKEEYSNAIASINQVRQRAGLTTNINPDKADVTEALINEYMFETMGEGKRWYQMLRFGACQKVKERIHTISGDEYIYLANKPIYSPLSSQAMTNNPKLTQTLGYN